MNKLLSLFIVLNLFMLLDGTSIAQNWQLDSSQSKIYFSSVKNSAIAEIHYFSKLSGQLNAKGELMIEVDLESVNTAIPIRDTRMKEMFFETQKYPKALITTSAIPSVREILKSQDRRVQTQAALTLHGKTQTVDLHLQVMRISPKRIRVISEKPTFVQVSAFDLDGGLKKLQNIANLNHISASVPVNVVIDFVPYKP
ncbi:MAG: YceI family protein [Pseudomonadota bacterium]